MAQKLIKRLLELISALTFELCKAGKLSLIIGSRAAFFSVTQVSPVIGFFTGTVSSGMIFGIRTLLTLCLHNFGLFTSLLYHIPTFCGTFYISSQSKISKIAIPLLCMFLFIIHPVGNQAYLYTAYWLIPIAIALLNGRSIFIQALGSTFTTHAVGSVIWLYTYTLNATTWNALISIVWAERLLFAAAMTLCYYAILYIKVAITELANSRAGHHKSSIAPSKGN